MRTIAVLLATVLSLETLAVPASALADTLTPGTRIRLTGDWPAPRRRIGSFLRQERDSVWIRESPLTTPSSAGSISATEVEPETTEVGLRTLDVTKLEISRGLHHDGGRSAIVGALGGAAFGAALGALAYDERRSFLSRGQEVGIGAVLFGLLGLLVGTPISLFSRSEEWETAPFDALGTPAAAPADSTR